MRAYAEIQSRLAAFLAAMTFLGLWLVVIAANLSAILATWLVTSG